MNTIRTYLSLTKPGIIMGNAITAAGGFFLASQGNIDPLLCVAMLAGISLIIASACVFNNYFDRDIDAHMQRTQERAFVRGVVNAHDGLSFGTLLGLIGWTVLFWYTNMLTAGIALLGFIVYVTLYTPLKRRTIHAALVGAVAGAVPLVVGYCAVTNTFDLGAATLFLVLFAWQMPHFDAIALYREQEYANASIPILARRIGARGTKAHMISYIVLFVIAASTLTLVGLTKYAYLVVMLCVGVYWLYLALKSSEGNVPRWARRIFRFSLIVVLVFSVMISISPWLP